MYMNKRFAWRCSGVAGVIVLWAATILGMRRAQLGLYDTRPISHLGIEPASAVLFSTGLLMSSMLFVLFAFYVRRAFHTGNRFLGYFLVGQTGQILVATVPYGANSRHKLIHTFAAFTLAVSLPFLIHRFARSQPSGGYRYLFNGFVVAELLLFVAGIGIFTLTSGIAPVGQVMPAAGFHLWIITLTWITPEW